MPVDWRLERNFLNRARFSLFLYIHYGMGIVDKEEMRLEEAFSAFVLLL